MTKLEIVRVWRVATDGPGQRDAATYHVIAASAIEAAQGVDAAYPEATIRAVEPAQTPQGIICRIVQ